MTHIRTTITAAVRAFLDAHGFPGVRFETYHLQEIGAAGVWSCDVVLPNLRGMYDLWNGTTSIPVPDGASIVNIIAGGGLPEITVYVICKVSEEVAA